MMSDARSNVICGALALLLCIFVAVPSLPAESNKSYGTQTSKKLVRKISPDQQILHLLDRFTFGPTPGEIAALREQAGGAKSQKSAAVTTRAIDNWFEAQLHPDRMPVTAGDQQLSARLADFPALSLPVDQLIEQFPSNAEIRQAANGKRAVPGDLELAAIYRRHIALYDAKQEKKAEAKPVATEHAASAEMKGEMAAQNENKAAKPEAAESAADYPEARISALLAVAPAERLRAIFALSPDDYRDLKAALKGQRKQQLTADMTSAQRELLADYDAPTHAVVQEMQSQRLLRDIYSSHQLQEMMITFWLNHFNIYLHKDDEMPYYLTSYERDVIRPRALGNFEDLLVATAESPAMLLYLDNSTSTGPDSAASEKQKQRAAQGMLRGKNANPKKANSAGLNENYARELMELHTLGVSGGYTQADVTEVARIFTGWTVDHPQQGGGFYFDESRHEPGDKTVMGHKIKEDGQKEGFELLHILANSPATAHFVSQEIAVQFVSDTPSSTLVNRMAQSFLKTHGDISSVLRTMLHSPEFWSTENYRAKVKTPLEFVVSAARAGGTEVTNPEPLINALNQMGMPLYACVPPTGYAAKADEWVSTGALVTRMNFGLSLGTNHFPNVHTSWSSSSADTSAEQSLTELQARLIPTGVSEHTQDAVLNQANTALQDRAKPTSAMPISAVAPKVSGTPNAGAAQAAAIDRQYAQIACLLIGSPEFQRR